MAHITLESLLAGASFYAVLRLLCVALPLGNEKRHSKATQHEAEPEPSPEPLPGEEDLVVRQRLRWVSRTPGGRRLLAVLFIGALSLLHITHDRQTASSAAAFEENLLPGGRVLSATNSSSNEPAAVVGLKRQRIVEQTPEGHERWKTAYYGTLEVGTPGVSFSLLFDTGSGHLVLPSTYCHSETCRAHKRYSRSKSSSAVDVNADGAIAQVGQDRDEVVVSFGKGEVAGVVVDDIVCMEKGVVQGQLLQRSKGLADHSLEVGIGCSRMRMIVATEMSAEPFDTFQFDGILGLGLSGLSQGTEFNFLDVVGSQLRDWGGAMPHTFGIFLDEGADGHSEIALGGWSSDRIEGDLIWNDVEHPELGHWLVPIKQIRVDDQVLPFCEKAAGGCRGVVDSGTSLLAVPPEAFPETFEGLRHMAQLDGSCKGPGPQLHIELEHFTVTLGPEDYAGVEHIGGNTSAVRMERLTSNEELGERRSKEGSTRRDVRCKPTLMSLSIPEPVGPSIFILGEPVLRKYYTVYDAQGSTGNKPRVGFARAARPAEQASDSTAPESVDEWFFETDQSDVVGHSV